MIEINVPNFGDWATTRLKFLFVEYTQSLPAVRTLYGKQHPEVALYEAWIGALKQELEKRGEDHFLSGNS